ncbi:MAG: mechanosensitive ion channel family protein [Candidatus Berkiella sp.]
MNELSVHLFETLSAVIFLLLIDFIVEIILVRNIKEKKKSFKIRVSFRYVLFICFLFFMAKIWVEGFGYLLTFIGVISAALTITQKEYLMNFIGWLIIMWRSLFSEGDYIEIGNYNGYVKHIGTLYFSLEESSKLIHGDKSGRTIKIPNSLVANHPIVNFSLDRAFVEGQSSFTFTFGSSLEKIQELIEEIDREIDQLLNRLRSDWSKKQQHEYEHLKSDSKHKPHFLLRVQQDRPLGLQLKVRYLSLRKDQKALEDKIASVVMMFVNSQSDIALSLAT